MCEVAKIERWCWNVDVVLKDIGILSSKVKADFCIGD